MGNTLRQRANENNKTNFGVRKMLLLMGITNEGFIIEYIHKENPLLFNKACEITLPKEAIELIKNIDSNAKEIYKTRLEGISNKYNYNKSFEEIVKELKELKKTDGYIKSSIEDKEGIENIIKVFECY